MRTLACVFFVAVLVYVGYNCLSTGVRALYANHGLSNEAITSEYEQMRNK